MSFKIRKAEERGHFDRGWLNTYHTFSFAEYHDPQNMGFSVLRVINDDKIQGGEGFPTHGHRDMEIITYVIEGALEHQDTLGNKTVIKPGEVQRMTAGTGIKHSEFNSLQDKQTHLLQIWILPSVLNAKPGYEQKSFLDSFEKNHFVLVGSPTGRNGSITLHQDVDMYVGKFKTKMNEKILLRENRSTWIQVVKGKLNVGGHTTEGIIPKTILPKIILIEAGDGLAITDERELEISSHGSAEFILFDLPKN